MKREARLDRIKLSSIPIRRIGPGGFPTGSRSGFLVDHGGSRYVLTAAHHIAEGETWAIEIRANFHDHNTQMYGPLHLNYLALADLNTGAIEEVDLAYQQVPDGLLSHYQEYTPFMGLQRDTPRTVFTLQDIELSARSVYGFYGQTSVAIVPGPGFVQPAQVFEPDLRYVRDEGDLHAFRLNHAHPGHDYYRGCSGSPILDSLGRVVALVVGGDEADNLIFGVSPQVYAGVLGLG